jgi:hypothetical protein
MRDLNRAGLLNYVRPEQELGRHRRVFDEAFVKLLDGGEPPPTEGWRTYTRLHVDKMTRELFRILKSRGLAAPTGRGPRDWWSVETTTAQSYMAYLASAICGARQGTLPVTDQMDTLLTLDPRSSAFEDRLAHLRYSVIRRALPAPSTPVRARELIEFKERNFDQLRRCRRYLDRKLTEIATVEDADAREVRADAVLEEIQDDVAALTEKMERQRWVVSFVGFGGLAAAALSGIAPLTDGGGPLPVGLGVAAGAAGAAVAAVSWAEMLRARADMTSVLHWHTRH